MVMNKNMAALFMIALAAAAFAHINLGDSPQFVRSVQYQEGVLREFKIYKYLNRDGSESYVTEVSLFYRHMGLDAPPGFEIEDAIPRSIVSSTSQIVFISQPARTNTGQESILLAWNTNSILNGEERKFSYRISRQLTPQMISGFNQPLLKIQPQSEPKKPQKEDSGILASLVGPKISESPLAMMCFGAVGMLMIMAVLSFMFGKKPVKN